MSYNLLGVGNNSKVKKGDGKDVHHVGGNALNKKSKLKVVSASKNRSYPRNKDSSKKFSTS